MSDCSNNKSAGGTVSSGVGKHITLSESLMASEGGGGRLTLSLSETTEELERSVYECVKCVHVWASFLSVATGDLRVPQPLVRFRKG